MSITPFIYLGQEAVLGVVRNITARKQAEEKLQRRTHQLSVLYAIDHAAAHSLELDAILNDALDNVLEVLGVEAGDILLLEPDGETLALRLHRGLSEDFVRHVNAVKMGEGLAGRAAVERKPVTMDIAEYPLERLAPFLVKEGIQSLASVPLLSAGELVGALNLVTRRPRAFAPEEIELLTAIGRQLGGAVSNARLHQETRQRAEHLSILNRIARALAATLNLDDLLEIVRREIMAVVEADTFFIALYDPEANELDFRIRIDKGVREPPERRYMAAGLTATVVTSKIPLLIRNFEQEKHHLPPAKLWGTMDVPQSWLGLPLLLGQDVIGVFSVQAYRADAFDDDDQKVLSTIADAVAVAVENTRLYGAERQRATRLAAMQRLSIELAGLRDERSVLTVLVNRTAALADSPTCTVMLIDDQTNEAVLAAQYGLPESTPSDPRRTQRTPRKLRALRVLRGSLGWRTRRTRVANLCMICGCPCSCRSFGVGSRAASRSFWRTLTATP
ncbi:MAG: GAF domain-containing protein [Chloroflexi bacterium]|nr:GAF domain-containing protein [Chloroflexota bacterium]